MRRRTASAALLLLLASAAVLPAADDAAGDALRRKALAGDAAAQFELGGRLISGNPRTADPIRAVYWFRRAAKQGHAEAAYNLGCCLENGWGVPGNPALAVEAYRQAAARGVPAAAVALAALRWRGYPAFQDDYRHYAGLAPDREGSAAALKKLGESGYIPAERRLAELIETLPAPRAEHWDAELRRARRAAADAPDANAADQVAWAAILREGIGGPPDMKEAARRLERAAATGDPEALAAYAEVLERGEGCTADPEQALRLLRRASESSPRAMVRLGELHLFSELLPCEPATALAWFRKAAALNYAPAFTRLGNCLRDGLGVPASFREAFEAYDRAARLGDPEGAFRLGLCFRDGIGVNADPVGAAFWFRVAARHNHPGGVRELGLAMLRGAGVTRNRMQGRRLLHYAASRGDAEARRHLEENP